MFKIKEKINSKLIGMIKLMQYVELELKLPIVECITNTKINVRFVRIISI